jgi:hypothetical protein
MGRMLGYVYCRCCGYSTWNVQNWGDYLAITCGWCGFRLGELETGPKRK